MDPASELELSPEEQAAAIEEAKGEAIRKDGTPLKCLSCGGCCRIYRPSSQGGAFPDHLVSLEEHAINWLHKFVDAGVLNINKDGKIVTGKVGIEPLHDPLNTISKKFDWVDVERCQFCHPKTGCMIPRNKRPELCRSFVCW
jgi:Fe-S-cluster containining protein